MKQCQSKAPDTERSLAGSEEACQARGHAWRKATARAKAQGKKVRPNAPLGRLASSEAPLARAPHSSHSPLVSQSITRRKVDMDGQEAGRKNTLMTPSSLSRNFLYISGASSRLAGWVTTKLGSISPASIFLRSGLV